MIVRAPREADLPGILEIESHEILHGYAHFGLELPSLQEARTAFLAAQGVHPWFVAEEAGQVVGFARSSPWKARGAYRWTAEVGVYVRDGCRGRGIGHRLYEALFPAMEGAGLRTLLAGIALPNEPSVRLHEAFGMVHVGTVPRVGFKLGAWRDVGYWARTFGEGPPAAP